MRGPWGKFTRAVRAVGLATTALLPSALKKPVLRSVFGFHIGQRVRLGVAFFDCAELTIEDDASVGHGVVFLNVGSVRVGSHAIVGPLNLFRGGDRIDLGAYSQLLRLNIINAIPHHDCFGVLDSTFVLGYGAVVASSHWIDFTDRVTLGRRSMLAGRNSSIWTHNRRRAAPIRIGDFCYLGSEVRIAPGVTIPDCSVVAMGSVVSSSFSTSFTFIGGAPARVTRRLAEADADTVFGKTRWDLPDEPVPAIPGDRPATDLAALAEAGRSDAGASRTVEAQVRRAVAEAAKRSPAEIELNRSLIEQGVDSLQLMVLREMLESALDVQFSDDVWIRMTTPERIVAYLTATDHKRVAACASVSFPAVRSRPSAGPITPGLMWDDLEIGMPLTGRNNLAETPLLQRLGDQRWRHMSQVMAVPTREIVDDEGQRLYATFFYVEMAFPPQRPMAAFAENDRLKIVSTMARYGTSMLDGTCYLMPGDYQPREQSAPFDSLDAAVAAGVPAVRLSNIFVRQFAGAEWLKKGRPAHPGFVRIPALEQAPDSYAFVKCAEKEGSFARPQSTWIPLTDGPVRRTYQLVPDRDVNGAGLVYFANYPLFLDICERDVLVSGSLPLTGALVDNRTLVHRRSAYLNNASAHDTLLVDVEPWIELPPVRLADGAERFIKLHINYRMYRQSDQRLMMVSSAEKVIMDATVDDLPFITRAPLQTLQRPRA